MIVMSSRTRSTLATAAFFVCAAPAAAQSFVVFDGERYEKHFEDRKAQVAVVEYVRASETLQNWTRLAAIRHFPQQKDPKAAAANLAQLVQKHNPQARTQVIGKDDGSEAVVDFITWAPGDDRLEFNVHRYRRIAGTPGLVAYQFAWRFRTGELADATATVRANRARWLDAMLKADWPNPFP